MSRTTHIITTRVQNLCNKVFPQNVFQLKVIDIILDSSKSYCLNSVFNSSSVCLLEAVDFCGCGRVRLTVFLQNEKKVLAIKKT